MRVALVGMTGRKRVAARSGGVSAAKRSVGTTGATAKKKPLNTAYAVMAGLDPAIQPYSD
ncbi:MAG: hypothetical protein Rhims3KO_20470 [Hyphomicrobiales bacterium]